MRYLASIILLCVCLGCATSRPVVSTDFAKAVATTAEPSRAVVVCGWEFPLPAFLKQKVKEGPDFTVTYLSSEERQITVGIYEGTAPRHISDGRTGVTHEKCMIDGQSATWAISTEVADDQKWYRAEVCFRIAPKAAGQFHVFMTTATAEDLRMMREAVGRAYRTPHHSTGSNSPAVYFQ